MAKSKTDIISINPDVTIISKIYIIRDQKVMLDFDLAALYQVETRRLNEQVKRNIERFPEDFMFRLTKKELQILRSQFATPYAQVIESESPANVRSQFATSSQSKRKNSYAPYAFTEHGVTMLASILKSERAIKMSIAVVRAFIELKKAATNYSKISEQLGLLKDRIGEHDVQLNSIYEAIENLLDDKTDKELKVDAWSKRKRIGFKSDA